MTIDLSSLPEIVFADSDAGNVEQAVITTYEGLVGRTLYAGDPVRLFLEAVAYIIAQQRAVIDFTGKMNLLRYATGGYLDHLGVLTGVERIAAKAASCTCRFAPSEALDFAVAIPAGTRVSPDGQAMFSTSAAAELAAGALYVDVAVQAEDAGESLNGLLPGQITQIVDTVAYIATVANTTTTSGGTEEEDDESFRARIQLSPESFSTAGPRLAYVYWAKTAHQDIVDVAVTSPTPGVVDVRVLMDGGSLPSAEVLALVDATLSEEKRRPLTDNVVVAAPVVVAFNVALTWYLRAEDATLAAQVQTAVAEAVAGYVTWQQSAIGRDVNPSELIKRVVAAGAKRCVVTTPVFTTVGETEVAQAGTIAVTYGGTETA